MSRKLGYDSSDVSANCEPISDDKCSKVAFGKSMLLGETEGIALLIMQFLSVGTATS